MLLPLTIQLNKLKGAVKGLTKLLQGNRPNTQSQQIPQFVPQLVQDNSNTLPQASQNQNPAHPQAGRGGRSGFRGRGGRGRGDLILCYWCRDFLPKDKPTTKGLIAFIKVKPGMTGRKVKLGNVAPSPVGNLSGNVQQDDKENC